MNLSALLNDLGAAAAKLAPLIGGSVGKEAGTLLGLGHSVVAAIASAKAIHTGTVPPAAAAGEKELLASVTAHAQSTFDRAEGKS